MDMSQYFDLFISEAREHVRKIAELTVLLEANTADRPTIDALFRSAHSIKGMAASMGLSAIAELAHKMEDLMDRVRHGLTVDSSLFDLLLAGSDHLSSMIDDVENGGNGAGNAARLIESICAYSPAQQGSPPPIAGEKPVESAAPARTDEPFAGTSPYSWEVPQTVRVKTDTLDSFVNTTGELITVKHRLALLAASCRDTAFSEAMRDLGRHLRELHDQVMAVRLMPLNAITERLPRMVRDLARKSGKEIVFTLQGCELELDRSILEVLGDPLAHILRNCVDHGIEPLAERLAAGKPAGGVISLEVARQKDQVEITIADDGRGMDPETICASAVAKGVISDEKAAALSTHEKLMLVCQPGFSTAVTVSELSGRGVGMDVVKTTLQSLGGSLAIAAEQGRGSTFILKLPLTVAIINVLLVAVGLLTVAVPLTAVIRTLELKRDEVASIDGEEVIFHNDEEIPLLPLQSLLNFTAASESGENIAVFIAEIKGRRVGVQVDRVLGHQEVFVKPLARPLSSLPGLNGAAILGDGQIIFILDIFHAG